tara:strand:- start:262 stop:528 length:267 start_codon:yes stop_codon:yes gene_type:complete
MKTKETALDILFDEIKRGKVFMMLPDPMFAWLEIVYNKAKEIEKNQIKDAYKNGALTEFLKISELKDSEQYYNETYNQQDNESNSNRD